MKILNSESRAALKTPTGLFCLLLIVLSITLSTVSLLGSIGMIGQPFAGFRSEPTLTISAVNEPDWTGPQAGVETYDRLLKVNDIPLLKPDDLKKVIQDHQPGDVLRYEILPKGAEKSKFLDIAVQRFSGMDFTRSFLLFYLIGFLHIFVGAIAYLVRPKNPSARAHLFMTLRL